MRLRQRAVLVADHLWRSFLAKDRGQTVAATGRLLPHGSLKSKNLREGLSWAESLPYKFITEKVALKAILILEKVYRLQYPIIPGVTVDRWRALQARTLTRLCYRVKKNRGARVARSRSTSMDSMDTQPWAFWDDEEARTP